MDQSEPLFDDFLVDFLQNFNFYQVKSALLLKVVVVRSFPSQALKTKSGSSTSLWVDRYSDI